jgi:hypothetical protein
MPSGLNKASNSRKFPALPDAKTTEVKEQFVAVIA